MSSYARRYPVTEEEREAAKTSLRIVLGALKLEEIEMGTWDHMTNHVLDYADRIKYKARMTFAAEIEQGFIEIREERKSD